jgi:hypothetical protein
MRSASITMASSVSANTAAAHPARSAAARPRTFLHVANGSATTRLIESAGIPGARSIWADPLHDGPVPGGITDEELLEIRERHLAGPAGVVIDPANDLRLWRAAIAQYDAYEELVLWFEHDLFDQLNLVQLLAWVRERLPPEKPVSLVCIGSFPGHPDFKGLGELSPEELAPLLETRQRISQGQYSLAKHAWEAFRAPTPEPLDGLLRIDTSALPFLAPAIERFLQEYPWTRDGLSRTERRLLELAGSGAVDLAAVWSGMQAGETAYFITDTSLMELAESLSRTSPPLLTFTPGRGDAGPVRGTVALTPSGRAVLAGQADRIAICGIDRWFGGVHVTGDARWRWDDARRRMTL